MFRYKEFLLYFLLMAVLVPSFARDNSGNTAGGDTLANGLTRDESALFTMINDLRRQNNLVSLPLSRDLCVVAQTHIADLIKWKPQDKGCSLHSWSGSGNWTSCCNTNELPGIECMKSKPMEITGYAGDGYELIYWGEENATAIEVADLWRNTEASADMILSRNKWSNYQWETMGVSIKDGYAALWFGDLVMKTDDKSPGGNQIAEQKPSPKPAAASIKPAAVVNNTKPEPQVKPKAEATKQATNPKPEVATGPQFHLIVGSYKEFEAANAEIKKNRLNGYPASFILYQEPLHRIVIASFQEYEKASRMKNELKDIFPGIWILKK